ncbi:hypothetical protein [Planktothrix agardhii]|uniref:hypothetical protein n=1 Tax=Planktothrix agardhii TaxID=1160 RepID=UPI0020A7059F|nr:hypothetical protein [Planktothrix agardhii]CAD5914291.1 hypothetical protein NO758_00243 [Planktothrix agardhii]
MSFPSSNDNIDQAKNSIFSSFKEGFALQLSDAIKCLGQISVIAITILIPILILWFSKGTSVGDHCIMSSLNFPIIGGGITALGLALMLGNPFIAILAGTLLGVILNIPFVQQFLQFMCK